MADPISILWAYGAVANIIDVLGKIITTFAGLHSQWQDTDLAVLELESGLTALNAALDKTKDWIDSCSDEPHHQLATDLERCVICCRLLISKIVGEISKFQITAENQLDVANKLRLLLKTKDFEQIQHMVRNQTAVMTLVLSVCNATTLSGQTLILEQPETRAVLEEMEDNIASLLVRRDDDPLSTQTGTFTAPSSVPTVLESRLTLFASSMSQTYHSWIRGSAKRSVLQQQDEEVGITSRQPDGLYHPISTCLWGADSLETLEAQKRSRDIDRALGEDAKRLRGECKVLAEGRQSREGIINAIKMRKLHPNQGELSRMRSVVFENVLECAKWLVSSMAEMELPAQRDEIHDHLDYIEGHTLGSDPGEGLGAKFGIAVNAILKSPYYAEAIRRCREKFHDEERTVYFLGEIARITSPNYSPTDADVMWTQRTRQKRFNILEARLPMDSRSIHLFDKTGFPKRERKHWIHYFDDITSVLFVMDLTEYDHVLFEDETVSLLNESLTLFEAILASRFFAKSSIILILNRLEVFKEKVTKSPLGDYFPDYSGGNDVNEAVKYLLLKFLRPNTSHRNVYPHVACSNDPLGVYRAMCAGVREGVLLRSALGQEGV